jgi:hypothetical protein
VQLRDVAISALTYAQRSWGRVSEDEFPTYTQDAYNDRMPLRQDEMPPPQAGFVSGRHSPPGGSTGNVFQDEIQASQRRRRGEDSSLAGAPSSVYSGPDRSQTISPPAPIPPIPASAYASQVPGQTPFGGTGSRRGKNGSRRQFHRDDWDDSTDEDTDDLELQHTYTLSQPSGPGHYDSAHNPFETQDTSYNAQTGGVPPQRLPSMRAVGARGVPGTVAESAEGDLAGSGSGITGAPPPQPPPHGQEQQSSRGVQLVETYAGPH